MASVAAAQTAPDWRKIGGSAVELFLAAPATGPIDQVWFSGAGSLLYARTRSGRVFQTADFETWYAVATPPEPPPQAAALPFRIPESSLKVVPGGRYRMYALGRQLYRSDDAGHSWVNLTSFKSASVVGQGQRSIAVSPANADQIVVANDFGVWRSMDGGLSWSGLNQFLPNLSVRRILSTPEGTAGLRILAGGFGVLELPPRGSVWTAVSTEAESDAALRQRLSTVLRTEISATASAGNVLYAGSADGLMWVSFDGGQNFRLNQMPVGTVGRVERIFVDESAPHVALAALSGRGPHILRTTNSGTFWDALDSNLPDASAWAVTADRAAGAVYAATDRGVFWARVDLENASSAAVNWVSLSERLPAAPATDVRLDAANVQLYAALDGYGVYAIAAPHRQRNLRIVNGGDFSTRPAAPGSLLSVIGGMVTSARGGPLEYPVLAASDTESQIQVPFEADGPNVELALQTPTGLVKRGLPVQPVSPAIMVGRDGAPMLWDAETGLPLDLRNGTHSNGRLQIWATGLGKVRPEWPTGRAAPLENPPSVVASVQAYLDGQAVEVVKATLVPGYIGFYLIEVQLPLVMNAGTSELYITADGQESNRVPVAVER
jgi:uncharacterized protein (TIGR03437 family)